MDTLIVLSCLLQFLFTVHADVRFVCPRPQTPVTTMTQGPCGTGLNRPFYEDYLEVTPGLMTVRWEESMPVQGSSLRISLMDLDSMDRCILLDHIPHNDNSRPTSTATCTSDNYPIGDCTNSNNYITLTVPDISCERCVLQLTSVSPSEFGEPCVESEEDVYNCTTYFSCSNMRILPTSKGAMMNISSCRAYPGELADKWPYVQHVAYEADMNMPNEVDQPFTSDNYIRLYEKNGNLQFDINLMPSNIDIDPNSVVVVNPDNGIVLRLDRAMEISPMRYKGDIKDLSQENMQYMEAGQLSLRFVTVSGDVKQVSISERKEVFFPGVYRSHGIQYSAGGWLTGSTFMEAGASYPEIIYPAGECQPRMTVQYVAVVKAQDGRVKGIYAYSISGIMVSIKGFFPGNLTSVDFANDYTSERYSFDEGLIKNGILYGSVNIRAYLALLEGRHPIEIVSTIGQVAMNMDSSMTLNTPVQRGMKAAIRKGDEVVGLAVVTFDDISSFTVTIVLDNANGEFSMDTNITMHLPAVSSGTAYGVVNFTPYIQYSMDKLVIERRIELTDSLYPLHLWAGYIYIDVVTPETTMPREISGQIQRLTSAICDGTESIACSSRIALSEVNSGQSGQAIQPIQAQAVTYLTFNNQILSWGMILRRLKRSETVEYLGLEQAGVPLVSFRDAGDLSRMFSASTGEEKVLFGLGNIDLTQETKRALQDGVVSFTITTSTFVDDQDITTTLKGQMPSFTFTDLEPQTVTGTTVQPDVNEQSTESSLQSTQPDATQQSTESPIQSTAQPDETQQPTETSSQSSTQPEVTEQTVASMTSAFPDATLTTEQAASQPSRPDTETRSTSGLTADPTVQTSQQPVVTDSTTTPQTAVSDASKQPEMTESPAVTEVSTSQPGVTDFATSESQAASEASTFQPEVTDSAITESPAPTEASTSQPEATDSATSETPAVTEASTSQPEATDSATAEFPAPIEALTSQPDITDSATSETTPVTEASTSQPDVTDSATSEAPAVTEASTSQPEVTDSATSESPAVTEASTSQPEATDSATTESQAPIEASTSQPEIIDSATSETPAITEVSTSQSVVTDSAITESPAPTEVPTFQPEITDSATSESLAVTEALTSQPEATVSATSESSIVTEASTSQPELTDSATTESPVVTEVSTSQPEITDSATSESPAVTEALTSQPEATDSATSESSIVTEASTSQPELTDSTTTESPVVTEVSTSQPEITDSATSESPAVTEALTSRPEATDSATTESSVVTEASTSQVEVTDSATSESSTDTETSTSQPGVTESATTESPVATEASTSQPEITDSATSESAAVTEALTSQPEATDSATTESSVVTGASTSQPEVTDSTTTESSVVNEASTSQPEITDSARSDSPAVTEASTSQPEVTESATTESSVVTEASTSQVEVTNSATSESSSEATDSATTESPAITQASTSQLEVTDGVTTESPSVTEAPTSRPEVSDSVTTQRSVSSTSQQRQGTDSVTRVSQVTPEATTTQESTVSQTETSMTSRISPTTRRSASTTSRPITRATSPTSTISPTSRPITRATPPTSTIPPTTRRSATTTSRPITRATLPTSTISPTTRRSATTTSRPTTRATSPTSTIPPTTRRLATTTSRPTTRAIRTTPRTTIRSVTTTPRVEVDSGQAFKCLEQGMFADPFDCHAFHMCISMSYSNYYLDYKMNCPVSLVFDDKNHMCQWSYMVPYVNCGNKPSAADLS